MGLWNRYVMPRLIACGCASPAFERQRQQLIPGARGRVLELGCGSGLNFTSYDPAQVDSLVAIDPDPRLLGWAREQQAALRGIPVDFVEADIESAALAPESVDTIVLTFVLCTIPDWASALDACRRVLKPGGQVLFCEHGLAPDEGLARWQNRIEPLWKRLAGGCHLTRSAPTLLEQSGFQVAEQSAAYAPGIPRLAGYVTRGVATAT